MPAKAIYLVRHGETEFNAQGRFQGLLDSPLTRRGREQAELMGSILAAHLGAEPDIPLHVSPLGRTRETAALLRRRCACAEPVVEPRLREVSIGAWDGLDSVEIHAEWPNALDGAGPFDWYFRSPNGESYEAASARLEAWLTEQQAPVIAVSHGLAGRLLRGVYLGLAAAQALSLPVPQDAVFRLAGGRSETLTLPAPADD
ncbi:probable phosphoglycerate mutase [Rhizobiales bacterium GAS113]|nr:probable phosphoglycerate mutase [Rhizobiales bacterium GAS113]